RSGHAQLHREHPLAALMQEAAGRRLLVARLDQLEEAVLRTQEDVPRTEARHVARLAEAGEAEPVLVDRERALQVAHHEDERGEAGHGASFRQCAGSAARRLSCSIWMVTCTAQNVPERRDLVDHPA